MWGGYSNVFLEEVEELEEEVEVAEEEEEDLGVDLDRYFM